MPDFLDFIRGGTGNQGAPVAGDLPSDGIKASDIRNIFSLLSDTAKDVAGTVNAFREGRKKNEQKPVASKETKALSLLKYWPLLAVLVLGFIAWRFFRK